ncbi:MAG: diaminopimelate dehydrogenase, partial [Methanomassiliicoccaceae archaeon]|nr:diaminopimelate dehydrogenase [Methanomassiliicoccaceae archaeon]
MMKSLFMSVLPEGNTGAFWGPGVSQGHGEAIRRVKGVADAIQYTIPSENIMNEIRGGSQKEYTTKQKHKRLCYVVAENGADKESIAKAIMEMPYYFADYETEVNFITSEEMKKEHTGMPHAGHVIRSGITAADEGQMMEFLIRLDSNPAFTASIMVAYARAAFRLFIEKQYGARTVLDIPVSYLSPDSTEKQISDML